MSSCADLLPKNKLWHLDVSGDATGSITKNLLMTLILSFCRINWLSRLCCLCWRFCRGAVTLVCCTRGKVQWVLEVSCCWEDWNSAGRTWVYDLYRRTQSFLTWLKLPSDFSQALIALSEEVQVYKGFYLALLISQYSENCSANGLWPSGRSFCEFHIYQTL